MMLLNLYASIFLGVVASSKMISFFLFVTCYQYFLSIILLITKIDFNLNSPADTSYIHIKPLYHQ